MSCLPERIAHDRAADAARRRIGDAAYATAWEAGTRLRPAEIGAEVERVLVAAEAPNPPNRGDAEGTELTPREREVLGLIVAGQSNPAIADALFISPRTAQTHVTNILAKLGVATRAEAAVRAVRDGLV